MRVDMTRKKTIFFVSLTLLIALLFSGCEAKKTETLQGDGVSGCEIYYIDALTGKMRFDITPIEGESQEGQVYNAFKKMQDIQPAEEKEPAVPAELELNSLYIDSGILRADFNSAYENMGLGDELIFRSAFVYTLTSFDFIDYVYITVDGHPLKMSNGQSLGNLGRSDIVTDGNISAEPTNYEILTLYFMSADGTRLDYEIREVEVNPNQPIERFIIEQLIKGPENGELKRVIPTDTKIRDISAADGVCYVDLSSDFVTKQTGSYDDAIAAVYSIVDSLCELEQVSRVQFLIEGERYDKYGHIVDITTPVEPNYDIVFE